MNDPRPPREWDYEIEDNYGWKPRHVLAVIALLVALGFLFIVVVELLPG